VANALTAAFRKKVEEAVRIHQQGHLAEAEVLYGALLEAEPRCADALHFLGLLKYQRADMDAAERLMRAALAIEPGYADAHSNLGNVLKHQKRFAEAQRAYETALALCPHHANAANNLGTVFHALGKLKEAWEMYERAIACNPRHADAYVNRGNLLKRQDKINEAIDSYLQALAVGQFPADAYWNLGFSLYGVGRVAEAAGVFRKWIAIDPESPVAQHMLAACSGENVPPRASDAYIRETFGRFADSFDAVLGELNYRAPELVVASIAAACGAPAAAFDVLDAGCGTGLCGALLRPHARRLVGVDLSPAMIGKATERHVYDELVVAELSAYLLSCPRGFDLIASADTLVYFGELHEVLHAAATALRPKGRFVFTLEHAAADTGTGFQIRPHGRYSHSESYVRGALAAAGLILEQVSASTLRKENGAPVDGLVVRARR